MDVHFIPPFSDSSDPKSRSICKNGFTWVKWPPDGMTSKAIKVQFCAQIGSSTFWISIEYHPTPMHSILKRTLVELNHSLIINLRRNSFLISLRESRRGAIARPSFLAYVLVSALFLCIEYPTVVPFLRGVTMFRVYDYAAIAVGCHCFQPLLYPLVAIKV